MSDFLSLKNVYLRYTAVLIAIAYVLLEARQNSDFGIFLAASTNLVHGINIYTALYKLYYHYYYSPLFALALFPLTLFPVYLSKVLWLALNLVFVFRTWKALSFFLDRTVFSEKQKLFFTVFCFLFVLRFLTENFHCGQMTLFILFLSTDGMYRIMTGRYWIGALFISLAINIKLLPLVLLPYLFYRRYLKAFALIFLFLAFWILLPATLIGFSYNNTLLESWWGLINPSNKEHIIDTAERSFHSLSSLLPTLLMDHVDDHKVLSVKRNFANLDVKTIEMTLNILRVALILFALYFFHSRPFKRAENKLHALRELSYLFILVPLIFPHQQHYAFYFMFPAGTYLVYYLTMQLITERHAVSLLKFRLLCLGTSLVFITNNLQLLLGEFGPYYEHFKIITYGALIMIPMLAAAKPEEIPVRKESVESEIARNKA
jgi:hypothetical protein